MSFKEFFGLQEAGVSVPGSASSGTSLQRNRPGSQKVFSPPVSYDTNVKHHQQEEIVWKNGIYSHILHMHGAGGMIEQNGRSFIPVDVILGYSDGRPWHEEAVTELQNSNIFSKTPVPIQVEVYVLTKPPHNAYDMTNLIRQNGEVYIPADSVDQQSLEGMMQQGWLTDPRKTTRSIKAYEVFVQNAKLSMAKLADYRNALNMGYNAIAGISAPTLRGDSSSAHLQPGT